MADNSLAAVRAMLFSKTQDIRSLDGMTSWALEDELMAYAKEHAVPGECEAAAMTRLTQNDEVAKALARAAYHADLHLQRTMTPNQQMTEFREHFGIDERIEKARPAIGSREHIADLMDAIAKREARPGETFFDSYDRLLKSDDEFREAHAAYNAAKE